MAVELRFRYCVSVPGLLKWLAIIFSIVVLGLICWEVAKYNDVDARRFHSVEGETYTVFVAFFTIAAELLLLFSFFFNCHNGACASCRCRALATWVYLLCLLLWAAAAGVQTWVTTEVKNYMIRDDDMFNRRAASAAFCFANVFVFIASIHQARYVDL